MKESTCNEKIQMIFDFIRYTSILSITISVFKNMPLYNPLTGNKRRRPTNETSKNKRTLALDAEDMM